MRLAPYEGRVPLRPRYSAARSICAPPRRRTDNLTSRRPIPRSSWDLERPPIVIPSKARNLHPNAPVDSSAWRPRNDTTVRVHPPAPGHGHRPLEARPQLSFRAKRGICIPAPGRFLGLTASERQRCASTRPHQPGTDAVVAEQGAAAGHARSQGEPRRRGHCNPPLSSSLKMATGLSTNSISPMRQARSTSNTPSSTLTARARATLRRASSWWP